MKLLSLKSVYKNLLKEAIIDQGTFLDKLVNIITNKLSDDSSFGNLLNKIIVTTKKSGLLELKVEQEEIENKIKDASSTLKADLKKRKTLNKKARKKAEVLIHKSLQDIKGLSGEPIDLKKMRPLYDSIVQYLSAPKDVDIEHCLLAADYYMQDFYDNADDDIKEKINNGKIEFDEILKTTKFYQRYFDFKSELGSFNNEVIEVYEDRNIRVVYPINSHSFNSFIDSTGHSVSWCTQSTSTWESYNNRQFVMILHDKKGQEGIISLKVNFNGTVDYDETCDVHNDHMDRSSVSMILPGIAEAEIMQIVDSGKIYQDETNPITEDDLLKYLKGLLDTNNTDEMFSIMLASLQNSEDGTMLVDASTELFKYAVERNKINTALEVYSEVVASLVFDDFDISPGFFKHSLKQTNLEKHFYDILFKKALNKRSHIKYYIAIAKSFNFSPYRNIKNDNKIKEITLVAVNKNNLANFKKILVAITQSREMRKALTREKFFPEFFKTKGFMQYFKEKKDSLLVFVDKSPFPHHMSSSSATLVYELINKNIDAFNEILYSLQESGETEVTTESMDLSLIARFIVHRTNFQHFDVSKISLEEIDSATFEIKKDQLIDISNILYTDIELVKILCKSHPDFNDALLKHFYSKIDKYVREGRRNESISFSNQSSYDVLVYLIMNSKDKVVKLYSNNGNDMPHITISNFVFKTFYLINKFGKSANNMSSGIKDLFSKIIRNQSFYQGHLHPNSDFSMSSENFIDYFVEIAKEIDFGKQDMYPSTFYFIKKSIMELEALKNLNSNDNRILFLNEIVKLPSIKAFLLDTEPFYDSQMTKKELSGDLSNVYCAIYVLANNKLNKQEQLSLFAKYVNAISDDESAHLPKELNMLSGGGGDVINKIITSTITIDKDFTKAIGRLIDRRYVYNTIHFFNLIKLIVEKCNEQNVGFYKEYLAEIFYNKSFLSLTEPVRDMFLINFISKGSDGEDNYLDTRDRVIVKNCLRDSIKKRKILSYDYHFIMDLCANLDEYSKFQLRTAFPNEERIKSKETNEMMIRNYIKLFFS